MDIILIVLIGILAYIIVPRIFTRDKSAIWNPLVFWALYFIYYVVKPCIGDKLLWGSDWSDSALYYVLAACISLLSILAGYKISISKKYFKHFNTLFDNVNLLKVGILLCVTAIVCYSVFKGFSISLFAERLQNTKFDDTASYNNPTEYITNLISLFCLGVCVLLANRKKSKLSLVYFIVFTIIGLIFYAMIGFRYRIFIMLSMLVVTFYLYPKPRKINWLFILPLAFVLYVGMGVIEKTRNYGRGLDLSSIEDVELMSVEASEGDIVAMFSARCIDKYTIDDYILFEPITTAVCMPIPRAIFPEKPDGYYMRTANLKIFNTIEFGAAMVMFAEAYISFGWFGIIFQGLFIGFLCRLFWDNYLRNKQSLGAITLLAAFNGFSFVWFSRGYLAQDLVTYMYFVIIPFWIARLFCIKNSRV